jgi:iron(III) transport system substrate-binding protein
MNPGLLRSLVPPRSVRWISIPLVALSMLFVACGNNGDAPATPAATPAAPASTEQTPTPATSADPAPVVSGSITVYSGRSESLIAPIIERFQQETGVMVNVRYGGTTEMAATLLEEGSRSPADVFIAQDPGGLAAVENAGLFAPLPETAISLVDERWRSSQGGWVGLSGRARVLVYNTAALTEADLPASIYELTEPQWAGKVGWAPGNGSFHAFVTAMRIYEGEERTREWLEGMLANGTLVYPNNRSQVEAAANGEILIGLVNHYYLHAYLAEQGEGFGARNHHTADIHGMISVAGGGILKTASNPDAAAALLLFLLSEEGQTYFTQQTYEYPVVSGIEASGAVVPLDQIQAPDVDINALQDLEGTLNLLRDVGALE